MASRLGYTFTLIGIALVAAPVSVVIALLLFPLWSWIEATFGLESIGHSGPATWCFVVTYALVFCLGWVLLAKLSRSSRIGNS